MGVGAAVTPEGLDATLVSYNSSGTGFDSLYLRFIVDGTTTTYTFSTLAAAEAFFTNDVIDFGNLYLGWNSVDISMSLTASDPPGAYEGFGFDYALGPGPYVSAIPEPSTWAMMLLGFAGLGFAGYRASRKSAAAA